MKDAALTILGSVGQVVGEEFRQLRAVGGEVAELRDELATMNAVLRMHTEAEDGSVDHFIREWMKQVRELAYDTQDCVDLYIFRIRCRSGDRFLVWSRRLLATLFHRHRLAGSIKALRARAVSISERHARYGVNREGLRRSHSSSATVMATVSSAQALLPDNGDVPDQFVGIQDQANTLSGLVKAMKDGKESEKNLKVFSIVGFGGLGKTTLAVEVCRQLKAVFDRQALVSVSQAFDGGKDLKGLLRRLLHQLVKAKSQNEKGIDEEQDDPVANIDAMEEGDLVITLESVLKDKRYLIVVDDVWTISAWEIIRSKLPDSKLGSRIIVTTRIENVAKECSDASFCIYQIKALSPEHSRRLFISRAFGPMNDPCPEGLDDMMKSILKKCGGLPLAIVSIASLLKRYKYPERKDKWDTICSSIGSEMESNPSLEGMNKILTLSYNDLPYHLKGCMMFLAIFPEDYEINKNQLLYRWIAERLVEEKRGLTPLEVAESYFDELLSRNLISLVFVDGYHNNPTEACRVHDMMLEVLVSKSLEANFVSLVGGSFEGMSYDRVRRLAIHGVEEEPVDSAGPSKRRAAVGRGSRKKSTETLELQHVRSLTSFDLHGKKLFDRLGELKLLRVLDLEDCKGLRNKHVKKICRMYLLKFLSLKGTDISKVPEEIGELEHLQVLDVRDTRLHDLPKTVTKLQKVERMDLCRRFQYHIMWTLPRGLAGMKALREVEQAKVDDVEVAGEVGELGQLRRIYLFFDAEKDVKIATVLARSLEKLCSLRRLCIAAVEPRGQSMDLVLDLKSPPRNLQYLLIEGKITKFPDWLSSLSYLTDFSGLFWGLRGDQLFGVLCKLPSLQRIKLWWDCYVDPELVARTAHHFPMLKTLSVGSPYDICPELIRFEEGSMVYLEELTVFFSEDNTRTIVGIQYLTNLKEVLLIGTRYNTSLSLALEELKAESDSRQSGNQFLVRVTYE